MISYGIPLIWDVENYGKQLNLGDQKLWEAILIELQSIAPGGRTEAFSILTIITYLLARAGLSNLKMVGAILCDLGAAAI